MNDQDIENARRAIDLLQKTSGAGLNTIQLPMEYGRPMLNYIYELEKFQQTATARIKKLERIANGNLLGDTPITYEVTEK